MSDKGNTEKREDGGKGDLDRMETPRYAEVEPNQNEGYEECIRFLFEGYTSNDDQVPPVQEIRPQRLRGRRSRIVLPPPRANAGSESVIVEDLINLKINEREDDEDHWSRCQPSCSSSSKPTLLDLQDEAAALPNPPLEPVRPVRPLRTQNSPMDWRDHRWPWRTWSGAPRREPDAPKTKYLDVGYCKRCGEVGGHWKRQDCGASSAERAEYADSLDDDKEFPFRKDNRESRFQVNQQRLRFNQARGTSSEWIERQKYDDLKAQHAIMIRRQELTELVIEMEARGSHKDAAMLEARINRLLTELWNHRHNYARYEEILRAILALFRVNRN